MNWFRRLVSRRRLHRELAEEIQAHLEEKVEDLMEGGLSRAEAMAAARRAFGNVTVIEERGREVWGWPMIETCRADVRYACRRLRRSPTFTLVSVLSIGLGIGATTAVFSVIHAVLISPYPYRDADRLVHLHVFNNGEPVFDLPLSDRQFEELQGSPIVDGAMAMDTEGMSADGGSLPSQVNAGYLSPNAFGFLGVPPLLGRPFTPTDVTNPFGPRRVVVLGYRYWQRHYGARPGILGQVLRLDGRDLEIIGVMPRRFAWWDCDVYLPLEHSSDPDRLASVFVRLKPGISDGLAEPALQSLIETLSKERPDRFPPQFRIHLVHMHEIAAGPWSGTLLTLFGAVGLVLVIGCANVSILLLARGCATVPELAIRAAIGASRGRIVRQLFTESIIIACAGGLLGMLLARIGVDLIPRLLPDGTFPAESVIRLSVPVLLFGAAVAVLTSVIFGLWPALSLSHPEIDQIRRVRARRPGRMAAVRGSLAGARPSHNLLVAGQVALAVVLLAGAGATIRAFSALIHTKLDYQPQDLASVRVDLRDGTYTQWDQRVGYLDRVRRRVASSPGVVSVAISQSDLPPARPFHSSGVDFPGVPVQERPAVLINEISAEYFSTLRIPLLRGRLWTESEAREAAHVAVINRSMARRYWPDRDPTRLWIHLSDLRATTTWALASARNDGWVQIVGVAADTPNDGLQNPPVPAMYIPYTLVTGDSFRVIARSSENLDALVRTVAEQIHTIDPDQPVAHAQTAEAVLDAELWAHGGLTASLCGIFALMALLLAAAGLYSVVSCVVSQRTHEFGVRAALGAQRTEIVRMILTSAAEPTLMGMLTGLALSVALDEVLGRWTHVSARDPYMLASVVVLLAGVTTAAALIPAYRAASIDPIGALRDGGC
jgi:putative ABC transport system permease protein